MRMHSIPWRISFKEAGDNVVGGDGYRIWQQVVVETEMRREMRVGGFVDDMLTRGIITSGDKLGQVLNTIFYSVMGSQIVRK
ncbi:hypothetical protein CEXT_160871 [Caerostris extrusa]|uniref:Uncharacterized protein n=1 Tax=Caerostris extrusa TaxID=172846 RepID=A0AAV4Y6B7_CAEEX|nr:hypothetical protein CEXT_160871 [Caerostris extrusa]